MGRPQRGRTLGHATPFVGALAVRGHRFQAG